MSGAILYLVAFVVFGVGYLVYTRYLSGVYGLDDSRETPAHTHFDGVDYVPTRPMVLLGHHFSSIAGAAPIVGPVLAVRYGWLPVFVWILVGGLLIGAVHDFSSLVISMRHEGRSLGDVAEERLGKVGKLLHLLFLYATLLLIVAVFTEVVAKTFVRYPEVGSASVLFMLVAVVFGVVMYRTRVPFWLATAGGLILLGVAVWVGYMYPLRLGMDYWRAILLVYVYIASVLPVWLLLQPRDYLNSFILFAMLALLVVSVLVQRPELKVPAYTSFSTDLGPMAPILFVTVACGAISGFHSLVASGTTSKQIDKETHARPVGFGAMLLESLLAIGALVTAAMLVPSDYMKEMGSGPITLFSRGAGSLLAAMGFNARYAVLFMSLAVAAFALTSLDTATRLARFALQELASSSQSKAASPLRNRYVSTLVTVGLAATLVYSKAGMAMWPLFGAANQLVAALAFLVITVWLVYSDRPIWFSVIPGIFMYLVTMSALIWSVFRFFRTDHRALAVIALVLLMLAGVLGVEGYRAIRRRMKTA